jgi:chondroitin 4-sulfotransferase 11
MLTNHKKKFIFVHIQKTAGLSITNTLKKDKNTIKVCQQHTFLNNCNYNKDYFKFCFVRNPWDRLVSWYNMMVNKGIHNKFSDYLLKTKNFSEFLTYTDIILDIDGKKSISFNQLDYISDDEGNVLTDYIGKFENINEDILEIGKKIGYNDFTIPHINKFPHKDYRTYYTDKEIELVQEMYKRDIDYFGYKFD